MTNLQITAEELTLIRDALWELLKHDPYDTAVRELVVKLSLTFLRARCASPPVVGESFYYKGTPATVKSPPILSANDKSFLADCKISCW